MGSLMSFLHHLQWVTIFGLLGSIISFLVFLSPLPTFYRIYKKKSTEGFQSIPYTVALFSSMLWIFYALFAPKSTFILIINTFGCGIETFYIVIFLFFATKKARVSTLKHLLVMNAFGFGMIVFVVMVIAKSRHLRMKILGWLCLTLSFLVFAAPLGVIKQVITTKSVKYMPFMLSFFLTVSAIMWFFYGFLKRDYFVAIPNILGIVFGLVQMAIYFIYKHSEEVTLEEEGDDPNWTKQPELTPKHVVHEVGNLNSVVIPSKEENRDQSKEAARDADDKTAEICSVDKA